MPAAWPTVGEMMTTRPVTLPPDAPISRALGVMRAKDIHEVPVLRRSRLIGMITFESIARRASRALATKVEHLLVVAPLITPSTTYAEIAQELLATGLRAAPVVGRKGELLGVVSRTDLVRALPDIPQLTRAGFPTVDEVASPATTFIREDDLCRNLVLQLRALEEHPLPVVDRKGRLVGAVGLKDLAGVLWRPIAGGKRDPRAVTTALDVKVSSIMHAPAVTVPRGTDVATAARRMLRENVSSVFVVDNDRPVRVLGHADLLGLIVARGGRPSEGRARVEDVYVEITGLRGSSDPALLGDIDHLVARALKRMTRSVRPRLLTIHFAPHATHRTSDLTVEARLHTDAGIFYASHTGWNLLAGVSGLLDELANQVQRTRESDRQRNRRGRRPVETGDTSLADPELEAKLRAATDAGDDEGA
jgi:CBS domain-containing protein/ribosome-associated translation inhibitor RaiA